MKLDNKIVLVTGVSSGIGAATASLLRFHGAHVIGIDQKAPNMTLDGFVQGDLSSAESIDRLLPQLPTRIDSLCNIAGVPGTANTLLLAQVNYLGVRHLSRALLPRISAGGSIVNIASMFGLVASDLLWVQELAALGHPLGTYASGRLSRVEEA